MNVLNDNQIFASAEALQLIDLLLSKNNPKTINILRKNMKYLTTKNMN